MATEIINLGGIRDRGHQCTLSIWWKDQKFEYDVSNNLIYRGAHRLHDPADSADEWIVWKYTYDVSNNCTRIEGPIPGTWDGRATMAWGS